MIVFILLLLLLIGIVYFLSRKNIGPIKENFNTISYTHNIYVGFRVFFAGIQGDPNRQTVNNNYGYKKYNYTQDLGVNDINSWNGNWLAYDTINSRYSSQASNDYQRQYNSSGMPLSEYFQPLTNYPSELNRLKRLVPSFNFNDNNILLCKYVSRSALPINDLFTHFSTRKSNAIADTRVFGGSTSTYKRDNQLVFTYVTRTAFDSYDKYIYLLVATDWFVPTNEADTTLINDIPVSVFNNKHLFSNNITYYPFPPSNMEKCKLTAQNIALTLRKDYKIMDGNPLQPVDLFGNALPNEDTNAINADCSSNIIDGEYLITRDISDAIIKCSITLNTLKKSGIKYGNMEQLDDCKYLQITDLPIADRSLETNTGDTLGNLPTAALNISYTNTDNGIEFTFTNKSSLYTIGGSESFYYVLNILSPNTDISGQIPFIVNPGKSAFPFVLNIDNNKKLGILSGEINAIPNSSLTQMFADNFTIYNIPLSFTISTYSHITSTDTTQKDTQLTNIDYNSIPYTIYKSGVIDTINAPITSNIDSSLFDGACEPDTKRSKDVEYCDAPANQIDTANKPFKLMKVQKLVTPTSIKCTKPRLIIQDFTNYSPQAAREIQYMQKQAHLQQRNVLF